MLCQVRGNTGWPYPEWTGGWIFGGTAAAASSGWNRTAAGREALQSALAPEGSIGLAGSIVLHDLWYFNGDVLNPSWRQIRSPIGATPGSPLWPPGVPTADGAWTDRSPGTWTDANRQAMANGQAMVLMLLIGQPEHEEQEQCHQDGCDGTGKNMCCAAADGSYVVGCKDGYELARDLALPDADPEHGSEHTNALAFRRRLPDWVRSDLLCRAPQGRALGLLARH